MTTSRVVSRRRFLQYSAMGAAALTLPPGFHIPTKLKSHEVVYAEWGGATNEARQKAFFTPFTKATGVQVVSAIADFGKFTTMAKHGPGQWDGMDADGDFCVLAQRQGLLAPLPKWVTRNDGIPQQWQNWFTGSYSYSFLQGYLPKTFHGAHPESWADFWNIKKFPGKRGWPGASQYPGALEAALMADGVPQHKVYPIDWARAFAKLNEIKSHLMFYDTYAQGTQYLVQGAVSILTLTNGRFFDLTQSGVPTQKVWNQAVLYAWSGNPIPQDAPHKDAAFALQDFMAQPQPQAEFARILQYGPTNSKAFHYLHPNELKQMPNSPENRKLACITDAEWLANHDNEYFQKYTKWITG